MKIRGSESYSQQYAFSFPAGYGGKELQSGSAAIGNLLSAGIDLFLAISGRDEIGVIVVDERGAILSTNEAAESLFSEAGGLTRKGEFFAATSTGEKALLESAIRRCIAANADGSLELLESPLLLISREDKQPLTLSVIPARLLGATDLRHAQGARAPAAVVLVADPEVPISDSIRPVCELYHLTPAETRLAELLIDGLTLAEIADVMRLKLATVRVYLKQIFMKTGVHRQPMLIRMLLTTRIPMVMRSDGAGYLTVASNAARAITVPSRTSS